MAKIVVGMSGGVDSSVTAYLLKQQGHDVLGVFMKNWEADDTDEYCSSRQDWVDCVSVADKIGIDIDFVNFAQTYQDKVFSYFLKEYAQARTPNPDILCNSEIKFKAFLEYALNLGVDFIATGHYASIGQYHGQAALKKAQDLSKDQTYFLHQLSSQQVAKSLFPLGNLPKTQVREIAEKIGLHNHAKKDSTGICFIGERPFRQFLNQYLPSNPGPICDEHGKQIGIHQGLAFYTLGQRKGLNLGGVKHAQQAPWFVAKKDLVNNTLTVVQQANHPYLLSHYVAVDAMHWINADVLDLQNLSALSQQGFMAKTRYRQPDMPCEIIQTIETKPNQTIFKFSSPQWAVTPGQYLVLYNAQGYCLGGGVIDGAW